MTQRHACQETSVILAAHKLTAYKTEGAHPSRPCEGCVTAARSRHEISIKIERMAERVGFEPTLPFRVNTLSKRAPSATRPSLRLFQEATLRTTEQETCCFDSMGAAMPGQ